MINVNRESLIFRAVQYQWVTVLIVTCTVFGGLQLCRKPAIDVLTHSHLPSIFYGSSHRTSVAPAKKMEPAAIQMPALPSAQPDLHAVTLDPNQIERIRIRRRDLQRQIAAMLLQLNVQDAPVPVEPLDKPTPLAVDAQPVVPIVRESPELVRLRRSVAELTAKLASLRDKDTELHPDVVNAREALSEAQRKLNSFSSQDLKAPDAASDLSTSRIQQAPVSADPLDDRSVLVARFDALVKARTQIDQDLKAITVSTIPETSVQTPLFVPADVAPAIQTYTSPVVSSRKLEIAFELAGFLVSFAAALMAAITVELRGDHLTAASLLHSDSLPSNVYFSLCIPRMRS